MPTAAGSANRCLPIRHARLNSGASECVEAWILGNRGLGGFRVLPFGWWNNRPSELCGGFDG